MQLKPCPFCGNHLYDEEANNIFSGQDTLRYSIHCYKCGARTDYFSTVFQAVNAWNMRANDEQIQP